METASTSLGHEEHALVMFQRDEKLSVVPRSKIVEFELKVHQSCSVRWTDGRKYAAELLFLGKAHGVVIKFVANTGPV